MPLSFKQQFQLATDINERVNRACKPKQKILENSANYDTIMTCTPSLRVSDPLWWNNALQLYPEDILANDIFKILYNSMVLSTARDYAVKIIASSKDAIHDFREMDLMSRIALSIFLIENFGRGECFEMSMYALNLIIRDAIANDDLKSIDNLLRSVIIVNEGDDNNHNLIIIGQYSSTAKDSEKIKEHGIEELSNETIFLDTQHDIVISVADYKKLHETSPIKEYYRKINFGTVPIQAEIEIYDMSIPDRITLNTFFEAVDSLVLKTKETSLSRIKYEIALKCVIICSNLAKARSMLTSPIHIQRANELLTLFQQDIIQLNSTNVNHKGVLTEKTALDKDTRDRIKELLKLHSKSDTNWKYSEKAQSTFFWLQCKDRRQAEELITNLGLRDGDVELAKVLKSEQYVAKILHEKIGVQNLIRHLEEKVLTLPSDEPASDKSHRLTP